MWTVRTLAPLRKQNKRSRLSDNFWANSQKSWEWSQICDFHTSFIAAKSHWLPKQLKVSTSFSTSIIFYKNFYHNSEVSKLRMWNGILFYVTCKTYFSKHLEYQHREICWTHVLLWFSFSTSQLFKSKNQEAEERRGKDAGEIIIPLKVTQNLDSTGLKVIWTTK